MDETPANVNGGRPNIQNARNEDEQEANNGSQKSASQHEGGDVESLGSAYEGGDGEDQVTAPATNVGEMARPNINAGQQNSGNMMNGGMGMPQQNSNANLSTLPQNANTTKWQRNYDNLTDKDRQEMLVDEIFALYLYRMSNRINQTYYKTVLAYVIFFRECLNEYGWGKKIESEGIRLEGNPVLKIDIETK